MRACGCAAPWPGMGIGARHYRVGGRWCTAAIARQRRRHAPPCQRAARFFPVARAVSDPCRARHDVVHATDDGHGRAGSVRHRRDRHPDLPQSLGCRGAAFVGTARRARRACGGRASGRRQCCAGGRAGLRRRADGEWRLGRDCRCLERFRRGRAAPADVAVYGGTDRQTLVRRMARRRR